MNDALEQELYEESDVRHGDGEEEGLEDPNFDPDFSDEDEYLDEQEGAP